MKRFVAGLLMVFMAALYGCGGSGEGSTPSTVSGTASQGTAIAAGTSVTLKDATGKIVTSNVGANGLYSVVVDGLTAPYVLNTGGFYSFASGAGTTNINPFTHLSMQIALGTSSISDSTVIPANFQLQFTSAVTDLKSKTDGMYPSSMTATQKDFLGGNITLDAGVDKVFQSLIITAPDAAGNFSVSVSGQQILSVTKSNGVVTIAPNSSGISLVCTIIFPISSSSGVFTTVMISGKTFNFISPSTSTGSMTFNPNNTLTGTKGDGSPWTSGTWEINSTGQLVLTFAGSGEIDTLTLTSATSTSLYATDFWTNPTDSSDTGSGMVSFTAGNAAGPNGFTMAMISGKSFMTENGIATFNINGTMSGAGTNTINESWTINSFGQLVIYNTGKGTGTFTLISGDATRGWTCTLAYSNGTATTSTAILVPVTTSAFTTAMISGKTFNYISNSGISGFYSFNPDGTGSTSVGTWSINAAGQLITVTGGAGGAVATRTLISFSGTTFVAVDSWKYGTDSGTETGTFTLVN